MTARISSLGRGYIVAVYRNNVMVDIFTAKTMIEIEYKFRQYIER